jgi:hypothetical protein
MLSLSLFIKIKEIKLNKLAILRIGSGTDELDWTKIKPLFADIFSVCGINITICVPSEVSFRKYQIFRFFCYY